MGVNEILTLRASLGLSLSLTGSLSLSSVPCLLASRGGGRGDELAFGGPRIVRIEDGIHSVRAGDFDSDGLGDLAVVNNAKARIELLLQRKPGTFVAPDPEERNVPADDPLFEKRSLLTEKRVSAIAVGDWNGDRKDDVAFYGNPRTLVVAYQGAGGSFEKRREYDLADGSESPGALVAGDANGDGLLDLVLLAELDVVLLLQESGGLGEPRRAASTMKDVGDVRMADFDGDGREDLLLLPGNDPNPLRFRFQRADGTLGPEIAFPSPTMRSVAVMPAGKGCDVLTIAQASGTLRRLRLREESSPQGGIALGRPRLFPFGDPKGARKRSVATGDVDGDGRADVLATDPAAARVLLYRQTGAGELAGPEPFPSYRESSGAVIADLDGDGRREVILLSGDEKAVGWMAWKDGRLTFPHPVTVPGTPLALEAADLDRDGSIELLVAVKQDKESRLLVLDPRTETASAPAGEIPLPGAGEIAGLRAADLDRDGMLDVAVLLPFDDLRVLRGQPGRKLVEIPARTLLQGTSIKGLAPGAAEIDDLDGDGRPELLFASKNYARAVFVGPKGEATVMDQLNARAGAEIVAVAAVDLDGDRVREAALLDKATKSILVMRRNERGVFEQARALDVGSFEFTGLLAEDLTGDGREDLVVVGLEKIGVVPAGRVDLAPSELDSYESREPKAHLSRLAVADLGGPPGPEVVALDASNHSIEILSGDGGKWTRLLSWKVFEEKSFEDRGGGASEPHGIAVTDVTGDGRLDLVVLAHDRVLVYPRE
jgi:VCBS repeat protein